MNRDCREFPDCASIRTFAHFMMGYKAAIYLTTSVGALAILITGAHFLSESPLGIGLYGAGAATIIYATAFLLLDLLTDRWAVKKVLAVQAQERRILEESDGAKEHR